MPKHHVLLPAAGAALLLAAGLALLAPGTPNRTAAHPGNDSTPSAATSLIPAGTASTAPGTEAAAPPPDSAPPPTSAGPASAVPQEAMPSGIAAAGDGPAGDRALQTAYTRDHPSDLPPDLARQLADLAGQVWLAETTGTGRDRWPDYFPAAQGAGRVYLYTDVRIQAVAVHTEGGDPARARADLLWVGTSPIGDYGDHRPATVHLARTPNGTWEPQR
ncbi:hypothetical protein [Streptomyces sp. NRRL B-24484]|uniref:hypothetical protein n=1 Tax=Streptomyces sp. NRRL B-24484 TaxID=1463833 RepID=UPI000693B01B|nr:hypothetical protein [Streptomyces sp. NRRL B-24484]